MGQERTEELLKLLPERRTHKANFSNIAFFNTAVSNPPYQMTSTSNKVQEGRDTEVSNIFHFFYEISTLITEYSTMIFPGGRWIQRSHGNNHIAELIFKTVSAIQWFPNGEENNIQPVFDNVAISDGVSIVFFDRKVQASSEIIMNGTKISRPKDKEIVPLTAEAISIVSLFRKLPSLNSRKVETNVFKLGTNWVEYNIDQVREYDEKTTVLQDDEIIAYLGNATPGKNKRVQKYALKKDNVIWNERTEKIYSSWKLVCSQGQVSKRPATSSYRIVEKDTIVGSSWLILGFFDTYEETVNYKKYIDTDFVRFLIEQSRGGKSGKWGVFVPDLLNYKATNNNINWNKDITEQLFEYFNFTSSQKNTINSLKFQWKDRTPA